MKGMLSRTAHNTCRALIPLLLALGSAACASESPEGPDGAAASGGGAGSLGTSSGSGGAAGSSAGSSAGSNSAGASGTTAGGGAGSAGDSLNPGNSCGMGTARAERKPVNMFVMFDRSGSMEDDDKWPNATAALTSFLENPDAAGLRVALRFFPHDEPAEGCTEDGCDATACSQPLVEIGELSADPAPGDAQEAALVGAIMSSAPGDGGGGGGGGGTPIYAALDGALRWTTDYQAMHPEEATVVIFVTDGEPNGCDEDFDNISQLATDAFAATGITTYAIGLEGSLEDQMDQIAAAGGTTDGIFIGNSANAEQDLLDALNVIRGQTLSCDFPMPEPLDPNVPIDPTKINVTFTPPGGVAATFRQVVEESACGSSKAWYYDEPSDPERIILCPAACELARNERDATIDILVGCQTVCGGLDQECGNGEPPPGEVPPIIPD
jgi:Mg-chelatase subunit ChlD